MSRPGGGGGGPAAGAGLAAVCSYGMPALYNWAIHLEQRAALRPWIRPVSGSRALDAGCGVGRWSGMLATRGFVVTGVDLSPTMVEQARRRANERSHSSRCVFHVGDLATLPAGGEFDLVLVVTVLQHVLDETALREALRRLVARLAPGGRMIVLEASPLRATTRCDSACFVARDRRTYRRLFAQAGLCVRATRGVDPMPLKTLMLPLFGARRWWTNWVLSAAAVLAAPINCLFAPRGLDSSWHTLYVLEHDGGPRNAEPR